MSTSTTTTVALPRDFPSVGEIAGVMVRYSVWCILVSAILDEVRAAWGGDAR